MGSTGKTQAAAQAAAQATVQPVVQTTTPATLASDADSDTIQKFYSDNYGLTLGGSIWKDNLDSQLFIDAVEPLNRLVETFGKSILDDAAVRVVSYNNTAPSMDNAFAWTSLTSNRITLNLQHYADSATLSKEYANDVRSGGSPKGTVAADILVHELGHNLVYVLERKLNKGNAILMHNAMIVPQNIVQQAYADVNAQFPGRYPTEKAARRSISSYADSKTNTGAVNYHETIAEAIADFSRNGNKAHRISKAIVQVMVDLYNS